jgi:hypothetical protein
MSNDPEPRRAALIFPAIYATAGVMLAAMARVVWSQSGPVLGRATAVFIGIVLSGVVWTSLGSHFLLRMGPMLLERKIRFAKALFEESDTIFHDLESRAAMALVFGNLDRFLEPGATPAYEHVDDRDWLEVALRPHAEFRGEAYSLTMPAERLEALRASHHPARITYLLQEAGPRTRHEELLRGVFPSARVRTLEIADAGRLVSVTVSRSDVEALHIPSLFTATLRAGLVMRRDDWYSLRLEPACAGATVIADDRSENSQDRYPMLAGIHRIAVTIPRPDACHLPLRIETQSFRDGRWMPVESDALVSAAAASVPDTLAPEVTPYAGYGEAKALLQVARSPVAFDVDGQRRMRVVLYDSGDWQVKRFDPYGEGRARLAGGAATESQRDHDGRSS